VTLAMLAESTNPIEHVIAMECPPELPSGAMPVHDDGWAASNRGHGGTEDMRRGATRHVGARGNLYLNRRNDVRS